MYSNSPRVLIVDNEPHLRLTWTDILCRAGYQVETAVSLPTTCQLLQTTSFQLILLDLNLKWSNGLQLVQVCHQHAPHVPIIILTAVANPTIIQTVHAFDAVQCLTKPISPASLLSCITAALSPDYTTP